jgi:hypothetical protein
MVALPFQPSVITETGLDIHRYICNGWCGEDHLGIGPKLLGTRYNNLNRSA